MTEVSVLYAQPIIPWYQTANVLNGFLWIEQNGITVAGSMDVAQVIAPAQTGDTQADLNTWVGAVIASLTGTVADPLYTYPGALNTHPSWGIANGSYSSKPIVAVAYTDDYVFGTLNIPFNNKPRTIMFRIEGQGFTPDVISPAYTEILAYVAGEGGNLPTLLALELVAE